MFLEKLHLISRKKYVSLTSDFLTIMVSCKESTMTPGHRDEALLIALHALPSSMSPTKNIRDLPSSKIKKLIISIKRDMHKFISEEFKAVISWDTLFLRNESLLAQSLKRYILVEILIIAALLGALIIVLLVLKYKVKLGW